MKLNACHVLISLALVATIKLSSQTNPATARRDWFVGYYQGTLKDSTANITIPCNFNVYWTQNHPSFPYPMDDSTIMIPMGSTWQYVVCIDSTIQINGSRYCANWPNPVGYGILKADASFYYVFQSIGGCACSATVGSSHCDPGNTMAFHGYKVSNIPLSVDEPYLESNSAAVYPNPAQGHVNVLTFVEFDAIEVYDILGKNYSIVTNQTANGYHIDLPENLNAGVYFLRMRKGNESLIKKVLVIKK